MKKLLFIIFLMVSVPAFSDGETPLDILKEYDITIINAKSIKEVFKFFSQERIEKINKKLKRGGDADEMMLVSLQGFALERKRKGKIIRNEKINNQTVIVEVRISKKFRHIITFIKENGDWKIDKGSYKFG